MSWPKLPPWVEGEPVIEGMTVTLAGSNMPFQLVHLGVTDGYSLVRRSWGVLEELYLVRVPTNRLRPYVLKLPEEPPYEGEGVS